MTSFGIGRVGDFEQWLTVKLRSLNADVEVFAPYILGILEEDGVDETEMLSSLTDVLEGLGLNEVSDSDDTNAVSSTSSIRNEIFTKWSQCRKMVPETIPKLDTKSNLQGQLAIITGSKSDAYTASRAAASKTDEAEARDRLAVKAAIMNKYENGEEMSDVEERQDHKNVNSDMVAKAEQETRDKAKAAAQVKKEKDKEDRDKQKKQGEVRKKKAQERAAKGERRR